jgi:hypothetical protein
MRVFEKLFGKKQPKCAICRKDIPTYIDRDGKVHTDADGNVLTAYEGQLCESCHRLICNDCYTKELTKAFTSGTPIALDKCRNCGGKLVTLMSINLP